MSDSPFRRLKHWGWGFEDQAPSSRELGEAAAGIRQMLGFGEEPVEPVAESEVDLADPRIPVPEGRDGLFTDDRHERLVHSLGKAYRDVVRGHRGEFENPPDVVAFPADRDEVEIVLEKAGDVGAAVIPFGGGTSVVGGVEPRLADPDRPVFSLDLRGMASLIEVDPFSGSARIEAGARGPALEAMLREHDLTLRHFPQSFEFSTLGGWVATRAGGHFATGETHIDDLVESITAVTPSGLWQSRRLPGSGAGPAPDRILIGSEGTLGVITDSWVRVRPRPVYRASATIGFPDFVEAATGPVREIAQSGLMPSNCRLIDRDEAAMMMAGDGSEDLLLLGFESAAVPVGEPLDRAISIAVAGGGEVRARRVLDGESSGAGDGSGADRWRSAFLMAPYLRDTLVCCSVLSETFESAVTWDRFADFHRAVTSATRAAALEAGPPGGVPPRVTCRLTHVYSDGAAPYFTVIGPAVRGGEIEQWDAVKQAASSAIIDAGGTITHHHAVGRDHRPWYDLQRPGPFADALASAKTGLDPSWMLNPGVLIDHPAPNRPR